MIDFTFLPSRQVFGEHRLPMFRNNRAAKPTDLALLLCESTLSDTYGKKVSWWLRDSVKNNNIISKVINNDKNVYIVDEHGKFKPERCNNKSIGVRPAFRCSPMMCQNSKKIGENAEMVEIEYGEYPQTILTVEKDGRDIEEAYKKFKNADSQNYGLSWELNFKKTRKEYTIGDRNYDEYKFCDNKYIRFVAPSNEGKEQFYWIKVEPIKWLVDRTNNTAVSEKILFSGIQFDRNNKYNGDFSQTKIKRFMEEHFSKEILPSNGLFLGENTTRLESEKNQKKVPNRIPRPFENPNPGNNTEYTNTECNILDKNSANSADLENNWAIRLFDNDGVLIWQQDDFNMVIEDLKKALDDSKNGKNNCPPDWYLELKEKIQEG